ncbi:glycosyltransferase [Priestia megaterium]
MKALFVHDHIFYYDDDGNYYTSGKLPYEVWGRYLAVFDHIVIGARVRKITDKDAINKLNISSGNNVSFVPLPSVSSPKAMILNMPKAKVLLQESIEKVDAVIARLPSELGSLAVKVSQNANKPYAVEVVAHAWDAFWNYGSFVGKIHAPFATLKTKRQVANSKYAIYVTSKFLQEKYPSNGFTANASNVELMSFNELEILEKRYKKIAERFDKKSILKIGLIGSLSSKYKGIDTSLLALSRIKGQLPPDFEFHVLGDGDPSHWIDMANQLGLSKNVFFDGTLPGGEPVYNWLDGIDLYIHPSKQEGLPRAVIEAMSRGCPIIASTVAGIPELLDQNNLHKPGDVNHLINLLLEYADNKVWFKEQAKINIRTANEYTKPVLDQRRTLFWEKFASHIDKSKFVKNSV